MNLEALSEFTGITLFKRVKYLAAYNPELADELLDLANKHKELQERYENLLSLIELAKLRYEATSELHASWEDCAGNLYDTLCQEQVPNWVKVKVLREFKFRMGGDHGTLSGDSIYSLIDDLIEEAKNETRKTLLPGS